MSMDWTEITVLTNTETADTVSEILLTAGSGGTMIEDKADVVASQRPEGRWDILDESIAARMSDDVRVTGYFPMDDQLESVLTDIRAALRTLKDTCPGADLGKLEIETKPFENKDWAEDWKKGFSAIRIGEHMVVHPGWVDIPTDEDDRLIQIEPGMAFGTGTHETTGMCTALIEKYVRPGMCVIDIGTGSGILAIAAAHMGASPVIATDLDPTAVRVAAENVALNGFEGTITTRCGDLLDVVRENGDVVIANIIADVIVMLCGPVRERIVPGGLFICSGIAIERREEVRKALLDNHFEILDDPHGVEWAAFAARKR